MNREQRREAERLAKAAADKKAAFVRTMAEAKIKKALLARGVKLVALPDPEDIALAQAAVKRAQERAARRSQQQTAQ